MGEGLIMMRRGALTLLALTFLALTACGGTAPVASLPEPSESPAASASQTPGVPESTGEILPEACGRYTAELGRSGAAR